MPGFTPNEGETLVANLVHKRVLTDRDANLELGLFTNAAADETLTEATVTEPTGTGYARIDLTDASWTVSGDNASYAEQTFTSGAGGWTGDVYGYFIATKSAGGTQRLLHVEIDSNGPYTMVEGSTYKVTPSVDVA
jgi:hypothetical protein